MRPSPRDQGKKRKGTTNPTTKTKSAVAIEEVHSDEVESPKHRHARSKTTERAGWKRRRIETYRTKTKEQKELPGHAGLKSE